MMETKDALQKLIDAEYENLRWYRENIARDKKIEERKKQHLNRKANEALAMAKKIANKEQHFLEYDDNGFWALFCSPEDDFLGKDEGK